MKWYDKVLYKLIFFVISFYGPKYLKKKKELNCAKRSKNFTRVPYLIVWISWGNRENYTQVFPYQTIAAIYSYLVIHNLGFIFLFKCASNKKKPSTFTSNRKKFIGRDIRKIIFLVGGNIMLFIYSLEILSPCAATNMSSNAKWKVFPSKSFFGGWGWSTVSMNYDFVLVIAWLMLGL